MNSPEGIARGVCPVPRNPEFYDAAVALIADAIRAERQHAAEVLAREMRFQEDSNPGVRTGAAHEYAARAYHNLGYSGDDIDYEALVRKLEEEE